MLNPLKKPTCVRKNTSNLLTTKLFILIRPVRKRALMLSYGYCLPRTDVTLSSFAFIQQRFIIKTELVRA